MSEAGLSLETATRRIGLRMLWDLVVVVMRDWTCERAVVRVSRRCGVGWGTFIVSLAVDISWAKSDRSGGEVIDLEILKSVYKKLTSRYISNDVNSEIKRREASPMQMRTCYQGKLDTSALDLPPFFNSICIMKMEVPAASDDQIGIDDLNMAGLDHYTAEKVGDVHNVDT